MSALIDEMDRRILRTLQRDAGQSLDALAEHVHLSRNACWRRIRRMEEDGVITGRVALVDASFRCTFSQSRRSERMPKQ